MTTHVLLPIDGSESAQDMVSWFANLFPASQFTVSLLQVVPTVGELPVEPYEIEYATKSLDQAKTTLSQKGFTIGHSEYIMGDPADSICTVAENYNVDQIILGSHGRSGLFKTLLGSVSSKVLEKAKRPVIVYKSPVKATANA